MNRVFPYLACHHGLLVKPYKAAQHAVPVLLMSPNYGIVFLNLSSWESLGYEPRLYAAPG
jgi:hypothetical protein